MWIFCFTVSRCNALPLSASNTSQARAGSILIGSGEKTVRLDHFWPFFDILSWWLTNLCDFFSVNFGSGSFLSPMTNSHHPTPPTPRADSILMGSAKNMVRFDYFCSFYDISEVRTHKIMQFLLHQLREKLFLVPDDQFSPSINSHDSRQLYPDSICEKNGEIGPLFDHFMIFLKWQLTKSCNFFSVACMQVE